MIGMITLLLAINIVGVGNINHPFPIRSPMSDILMPVDEDFPEGTLDFDSLNVTWVGAWSLASNSTIIINGPSRDTVFLGAGGGVYVLDITDTPFVEISEINTRGLVRDLFYDSTTERLFIADDKGGLEIWDVSNLSSPVKLSASLSLSYVEQVKVSGQYCYVLDMRLPHIVVMDVSDPYNPQEVARFSIPAYTCRMGVIGSYLFVLDCDGNLRVIDASDLSNIHEIAQYVPLIPSHNIYTFGHYVFIAGSRIDNEPPYDATGRVEILDVSNPYTPRLISYAQIFEYIYSFAVDSPYIYMVYSYPETGMSIFDIGDMSHPVMVANTYMPSYIIYAYENRLYMLAPNNYMKVFDSTHPDAIREIGRYDLPGKAMDVFVAGHYVYAAYGTGGLRILDVSDPTSPYQIGHYDTPGYARGVYVSGNYAYIADFDGGLRIVDISDPSNPQEVGHCDEPDSAFGVFVSGDFAYVADRSEGLRVISVRDPSNPYEVGHYNTPGIATNVYVDGYYAYVADGTGGVRIIDIGIPSSPQEIGHYQTEKYAWDVFVKHSRAYVATDTGLVIVDVSNPSFPRREIRFLDGDVYGVFVEEPYVYIAGDLLWVRDTRSHATPLTGYYSLPCRHAPQVYVRNNYIYLADLYAGIQIYRLSIHSVDEDIVKKPLPLLNVTADWNELSFSLADGVNLHIHIYSATGRLLWEKTGYFASGQHILRPDKKLPDGIYFVVVKPDGYDPIVAKMVVLK